MSKLRFAVIGTGFWSNFQIPAWKEFNEVDLVAVYNRTKSKAFAVAGKFGVPGVYDSMEELLDKEKLDFVDIITDVSTHASFTVAAPQRGIDIVCQKPMASSYLDAHKCWPLAGSIVLNYSFMKNSDGRRQ